jgi:hypothetical protein
MYIKYTFLKANHIAGADDVRGRKKKNKNTGFGRAHCGFHREGKAYAQAGRHVRFQEDQRPME